MARSDLTSREICFKFLNPAETGSMDNHVPFGWQDVASKENCFKFLNLAENVNNLK